MIEHLKRADHVEIARGIQPVPEHVVKNAVAQVSGGQIHRVDARLHTANLVESQREGLFQKKSVAAANFQQPGFHGNQGQAAAEVFRVGRTCQRCFIGIGHRAPAVQPRQFALL